jgi:5'-AMP-activated protein kinase catalytic alpha subunit
MFQSLSPQASLHIELYEVIETEIDIYLVTEYVKFGELFDYIVETSRLQEDEARKFFRHVGLFITSVT